MNEAIDGAINEFRGAENSYKLDEELETITQNELTPKIIGIELLIFELDVGIPNKEDIKQ